MLDRLRPFYAPLLLPTDTEALAAAGPLEAAVLPATAACSARHRGLAWQARARAELLFVDPRTAAFQFEGYLAMEELRSLPYGPGRGTLGDLWQPRQLDRAARHQLIDAVRGLQLGLGADVVIAPYFLVPGPEHDWFGVATEIAIETRAGRGSHPVAVNVCVDIDAILVPATRRAYADAFGATGADIFLLTVIDLDERAATPDEVDAVLDLLARLGNTAPTMLMYAGRLGLNAIATGSLGYAGGVLELESHPRRYLREGLVNLRSNVHYLTGAMLRLPVRVAAAVRAAVPEADGPEVPLPTRMVRRRRTRCALQAKIGEARWLAGRPAARRRDKLARRLDAAVSICQAAHAALRDGNGERLGRGDFHYLEVLRQVAGGAEAEVITDAGF